MNLSRLSQVALLGALVLQLSGCAASNAALRSQPAGFFDVKDFPVASDTLKSKVTLRCAKIAGTKYKQAKPADVECDSVAADLTGLTAMTAAEQKAAAPDVINLLLALSDYNCSNFLSRAFAAHSSLDFASKLLADLATGAAAGTVTLPPGVSAGFSGLNLLTGKTNAEFDVVYYANQAFEAMAKAIAAERTKRKTEILARRDSAPTPPYLLTDAVSDARYYDDACSIRSGLQSLTVAADQAKNTQDQHSLCVAKAAAGTEKTQKLMAMKQGLPPNCP